MASKPMLLLNGQKTQPGTYSMDSDFDIEQHKTTFTNYLEVIITRDGTVMYAVPSHQEKAMSLAVEELGKTAQEIADMCPKEYYFDYLNWLLSLTGSAAVWSTLIMAPSLTKAQVATLRRLKMAGLLKAPIPKTICDRKEKE